MANSPVDLETAIAAARAVTTLVTDEKKPALQYDPIIGEQALYVVRPSLLAMDPSTVMQQNIDALLTALVVSDVVDHLSEPEQQARFAEIPDSTMGEARAPFLKDLAQSLFYLENRARSSAATSNNVRVDAQLFQEGVAVRERMLRVLGYHFAADANMQAELADIRSGQGYVDLASDLARVATHYTRHRAILEKDVRFYKYEDMVRARGISSEILAALQAESDSTIVDLRNRAFTKMARVYARLKAACDFMFADSPTELATFQPLRQAVIALSSKSRRNGEDDVPADPPAAPGAPIAAPVASPVAAPVAQPLGTGPGGSPLI